MIETKFSVPQHTRYIIVGYYGVLLLAVAKLHEGGTYLDAIVAGGTQCEVTQCDHSVGYGGR